MNDLSPFAKKLRDLAIAELETFGGIDESSSPLEERIEEYCKALGIKVPADITEFPWSAVFVSWCVKTAGATKSEFKFSAQHSVFAQAAIRNALRDKGVFRGRRITDYAPQIGDIIQWNRSNGTVDYDEAADNGNYPSHSAIVVDFETQGGKRYAITIGGNEGDSIGRKRVPLHSTGFIIRRKKHPYICIIENLKQDGSQVPVGPDDETFPGPRKERTIARRASGGMQRVKGPIVETFQRHLTETGFPVGSIDGDFGNNTLAGLQEWQKSRGFEVSDSLTASQWTALAETEPPSAFDLCLQLTASFEGTGFTGSVGNFDGAGLTFGIIGFTAMHGELGKLVAAAKQLDPSILSRTFGPLADELEDGLAGSAAERVAFGQSISKGPRFYRLQPEWTEAFKAFGSEPAVRWLQLDRAYSAYWSIACKIFEKYQLEDMLDACLAYDIAVQNGGIKRAADAQIRARLGSTRGEERRVVIAEAVRNTSTWKNDVAQRKMTIARGVGTVHGANYELSDWGLEGYSITADELKMPSTLFRLPEAVPASSVALDDRRQRVASVGANSMPTGIAPSQSFGNGHEAQHMPAPLFSSRKDLLLARVRDESPPRAQIAGSERQLNGTPDVPDARDRFYDPSLVDVKLHMPPPDAPVILDQGREGACTGFALAAVINQLNGLRRLQDVPGVKLPNKVSTRMLYEMAKQHDEWTGTNYSGSSLRGAMKGFFHNGVCEESLSPYDAGTVNWMLTADMAKDARNVGLGAYYRLRRDVVDYHAALCDVGAICVSARVHEGWNNPVNGRIQPSARYTGGHAFAIVGYDKDGFFIQNSWGKDWGGGPYPGGIAHWRYEDWVENVFDAWVLRLSVPIPEAFEALRSHDSYSLEIQALGAKAATAPRRSQIVGHIINIDDGILQEKGGYATPLESLGETARLIKASAGTDAPYRHVMFYAHGGLNGLDAAALRAAALAEPFKRNGIYPIFWLWGTEGYEVAEDALRGAVNRAMDRVGGILDAMAEFRDSMIETMVRKSIGKAIWGQMKTDAETAFKNSERNGLSAFREFFDEFASSDHGRPQFHFVGHSAGSILIGHALQAMAQHGIGPELATVQLMAPACTTEFFDTNYLPLIGKPGAGGMKQLSIYALTDAAERDDSVFAYGKSLLYLVSNACEDRPGTPILGMQNHLQSLEVPAAVDVHYAADHSLVTASATHGGFDNDLATMNTILNRMLGHTAAPGKMLRAEELRGY